MRLGWGAVFGAFASIVAVAAFGADATARLSWVRGPGAETCADAATIRSKVAARLGRDPFTEVASQSIEGTVAREGNRWIARLYVRDAETGALKGQRELVSEAEACSTLDAGVTLAIALAIDPDAALAPHPSTSVPASGVASASASTSPTAPSASAPPSSSGTPPSSAPARDPAIVTGLALAGAGLVPNLGYGVMLSFEPSLHGVRPWFAGALVPGQRSRDQEISVGQKTLRGGACARLVDDPHVVLSGCGALEGGVVTTVAHTLAPDAPGDRFFLAAVGAARLQVAVSSAVLELLVEGVVPFTRYRFTAGAEVGRPVELFRQWPVAPRLALGLGWAL